LGIWLLWMVLTPQNDVAEKALQGFWRAETPADRARAAEDLLRTGVDFDWLWAAMQRGRDYRADATTGRSEHERVNRDGQVHPFSVVVPDDYRADRRYPLRVYLHGGVNAPWRPPNQRWPNHPRFPSPVPVAGEDWITLLPSSWNASIWWQASQAENLRGVVDWVKQHYNVDENRIYLVGLSDGATGAYFQAFRDSTPWAALLPFIGHPAVLANPNSGVDGEMFVPNLINKPFFIVNGELDPLYPAASVAPYVALFREAGVDVVFHAIAGGGHNARWWPGLNDEVEGFLAKTARNPYPDRIDWQTERVDDYGRIHWLAIKALGETPKDTAFESLNQVTPAPPRPVLGVALKPGADAVAIGVNAGSVAARAGLRKGDRLIALDGAPISSAASLGAALAKADLSRPVSLDYERKGKAKTVDLVFPEPPPAPSPRPAFPHRLPSGRVSAVKTGNLVTIQSQGVARMTLLLSPEHFDFDEPVQVSWHGETVFSGVVKKDAATLMKWAARDLDRAMLFAAELNLKAP